METATTGPPTLGTRPPGPRGRRWTGCLEDYEQDRLGFLMSARDTYGGLVAFDVDTTIVNDRALAGTVLHQVDRFAILGTFLNRRIGPGEAAATRQARQHLNAGLRREAVQSLGAAAATAAVAGLEAALAVPPSGVEEGLDPLAPLERALSTTVAGFAFGDTAAADVTRVVGDLLEALSRVFGNPLALPAAVPTPANLRIRSRYRRARAVLDPLLRDRRADPRDDFASRVVTVGSAAGLDHDRIADLLIGSLLAGYRVPAAAASWILYELARSPAWARRARYDDDALTAVVIEAGRLQPPTWLLRRVATGEVELGGYRFAAGHNFLISPYVIHRDPELFADPTAFRPDRWLAEEATDGTAGVQRHLLTYGSGFHRCPGRDASAVMLQAVTRAVLERYDLVDASRRVTPSPRSTLVPEGLRLRLVPRLMPVARLTIPAPRASGSDSARPQVLHALREALPRGLAGGAHGVADLCPRELP